MSIRSTDTESPQTAVRVLSHSTVLLVDDVARAVDYYQDRLGFEVEFYDRLPEHYGFATRCLWRPFRPLGWGPSATEQRGGTS